MSLAADDFEPKHGLIVANVSRVYFDQQPIEAHDSVGIDIGHME
jgi:hypothetical protein